MTTKKKSGKRKKKKQQRHSGWLIAKYGFLLLLAVAAVTALFVWSVSAGIWGKLPDYKELMNIQNDEASVLYSEDGEVLGKYYIENRTNVNFKNISQHAIDALIATEDVRFYKHEGVDRISLMRVFFKTLLLGQRNSGGGSTISQQLAKNLYPRAEQQVTFMPVVKLKEMMTAQKIESIYTKDEILTLYLNTVSFGENTFGIESAAQKFFSTSASNLSLVQAATLIGMLKGPSYYNPRLHPERALERRNTVIGQMVKYGFLQEDEGEELKKKELEIEYKPDNHYSGLAPYLREQIRRDATEIITRYNEEYGTDYNLYRDGLVLVSTVDAEMQRYAEEAAEKHIRQVQASYYRHLGKTEPWDKHPEILKNAIRNSRIYKKLTHDGLSKQEVMKIMGQKKTMHVYSAEEGEMKVEFSSIDSIKHYLKIFQPALIAVEPQTGKVKAWVGGADYKYFQYDQVTAPRQVGSVFKPVVYSAAIQNGARIDAYYANEQKTYEAYDNWTPRNSDNQYGGFYTLKGALSKSINTIAVEVLMQTGIDTVINHARSLGISSELPPFPSLALGTAEIPLQEMVNPFMAFANNGKLMQQYYLEEIRDREGKVIYRAPESEAHRVLSSRDAQVMNHILKAVVDEGTGRQLRTRYGLHNEIAGKTGTTQNHVDGWFIGYTPRLVVGVRVGANDAGIHFNSLRLGQGAAMALPIYGEFMKQYTASNRYSKWNNVGFPIPPLERNEHLDAPEFKEHLNLIEKLTNQKMQKVEIPSESGKQDVKPPREGFLKRLFKKKKDRDS